MQELKPCPFCGMEAKVLIDKGNFQIVGCSALAMLCPMPHITVYKDESGEWNYKYWNKRV